MRTTIYKTASAVILLLTIIIPAYAQQETTLIMKNGSKITGNIVVQRPGKDITVEATEALLVVSDGEIKSKKDKYVRYEKLPREWKRWAMETKALEPMLSRNIIKLQITDNHILSKAQSKSKSF